LEGFVPDRYWEDHVQTEAGDQAVAAHPVPQAPAAAHEEVEIQGVEARAREEIGMLLVGFGVGISIAFVFLVYILFDIAHLLP